MNGLTDAGYENIQRIINTNGGYRVTREWIDANYEALSQYFDKDTPEIRKMYDVEINEKAWWTFENEANSGSIDDTAPREKLIDGFAMAVVGVPFPCYGDGTEAAAKFYCDLMSEKTMAKMAEFGCRHVDF